MITRKQFAPADLKLDFKALSDGSGSFSGYGAVYGNIDRDEEIIKPGAFGESLADFIRSGFIGLAHNWDEDVATIKDAREDDYGLYIECEFHGDEKSQSARQKMLERLERGKSVGLSVGFRVLEWGYDEEKEVRTINRGHLYETSIVTVPANPLAQVTGAKSLRGDTITERYIEGVLREAGLSRGESRRFISHGYKAALRDAGSTGSDTPPADTPAPDIELLMVSAELTLVELELSGFRS